MTSIPVRHGRRVVAHAIVDQRDAQAVASMTWRMNRDGYAIGSVNGSENVLMHRLILGAEPGQIVDHINGEKLDNRRSNIRICTQAENCQNVSGRGGTSVHRGVSWRTAKGRWCAQVRVNNKVHHLGYFNDELEAAQAASAFRAEHMPFSEDARAARESSAPLVSEAPTERTAA